MGVQVSLSSEKKTGRISVIPHIENGGCMEMEGISDLGWAVGTDIGIERGWQRRGHRCSRSCRLGIVRRILGCRIDTQMDVVVAAAFDGCRGFDLAPALPLACPTFLHMVAMLSDPPWTSRRRRRRPVRLRPRPRPRC